MMMVYDLCLNCGQLAWQDDLVLSRCLAGLADLVIFVW